MFRVALPPIVRASTDDTRTCTPKLFRQASHLCAPPMDASRTPSLLRKWLPCAASTSVVDVAELHALPHVQTEHRVAEFRDVGQHSAGLRADDAPLRATPHEFAASSRSRAGGLVMLRAISAVPRPAAPPLLDRARDRLIGDRLPTAPPTSWTAGCRLHFGKCGA